MQRIIIPTTSEGSLDCESVVRIVPLTPRQIQLPVQGEFRPFVACITYDCQGNKRRPEQKTVHSQDRTRIQNNTAEPDQGRENLNGRSNSDINQDIAIRYARDLRVFPSCRKSEIAQIGFFFFTSEPGKHSINQPHRRIPQSYQD